VALSNYLANYAVATGVVAFLCVLLGINSIQRRLGMTTSLVLLPVLVAGAVVLLKFNPYLSIAFWIMVTAKAINYALNQPTLKQVYIPTTKDTKYKAAAWLEMFGSRGAKAGGSGINALQGVFKGKYGSAAGVSLFLTVSSGISLSLIVVWLFAAVFVAKKYNRAIERNEVVC
jgi:AAA family ATP:ADP antiporter